MRKFGHERAYIPKAIRATADKLAAADFDFSEYNADAVLKSPGMREVERTDFDAPRDTLEYGWARFSCLLHELRRRQGADELKLFDRDVLDRYSKDLENVVLQRKSLEGDVANYRAMKQADPYATNEVCQAAVRKLLRRLYILLGCALRLQLSSAFASDFGFVLKVEDQATVSNRNIMTVGLAVMTASVFIAVYAAVGLATLGLREGFWTPSAAFPADASQPFTWAISALLAHGTAIIVADWLRDHRLRKRRWFTHVMSVPRRNPANYVYAAILAGIAGLVVNYLWGLIFTAPSIGLLIIAAPSALLPAATGAFYAFHLDNSTSTNGRGVLSWSALSGVTACGLVVSYAQMPGAPIDFVTINGAIGVVSTPRSLVHPARCRSRAHDPPQDEINLRIDTLRAEALKYFPSRELADRWVDLPLEVLGDKSPKEGSTDIALYEKA